MSDHTFDPRGWHIARNKVMSRDERSQSQLRRRDRVGTRLLFQIVEELGHARFSFEEMFEAVGNYTVANTDNQRDEVRAALNNLLTRELVEEVADDVFEASLAGLMLVENIPEGMGDSSDE